MICDKLKNADIYKNISENFRQAFELLEDKSITEKEDGTYPTDNPDLQYIIVTYDTRSFDDADFETHKDHVDIQLILSGDESMGFHPADELKTKKNYDAENDFQFYHNPEKYNIIDVKEGEFCIFFPHDAHLPSCHVDKPKKVKKIVVKVKV